MTQSLEHDGYRSRKFWIAVAILVASFGGLVLGKLTGSEWVSICSWVLGIFATANVGEKFKHLGRKQE